jgi:hypothetical protein
MIEPRAACVHRRASVRVKGEETGRDIESLKEREDIKMTELTDFNAPPSH